MTFNRCHRTMAGILLLVACVPGVRRDGVAADGRVSRSPLPRSTSGEIIPRDLRARLEVLAHDSMMGREAGTMGNFIASEYLAAEARRIGLTPAGADGSWFQAIPLGRLGADTAGHITAGDVALKVGRDVVPIPSVGGLLPFSEGGSLDGVLAVYGGRLQEGDGPLSEGQVDGKLVVFDTPQTDDGKPLFNFATPPLLEALGRLQNAAGIAVTTLDITPARVVAMLSDLNEAMLDPADPSPRRPIGFIVTRAAASALMGRPLEGLTVGTGGETLHGRVNPVFVPAQYPARNVVAVLRGSDPQLRREYIAVVAHSDHEGFAPTPVDHDSVLAHNTVLRPWGADSAARPETPDRLARVRAIRDSLARVGAGPLDSILNGADDDGSGSVALLEIAEAFVQSGRQPRRSLLFVWHTAEEKGLLGAKYFVDHPTIPRAAIVAVLNLDMVGRGGEGDLEGGGPRYLQLVGSRRRSTELGNVIEAVNREGGHGFRFDYQFDAEGHPNQYYCRGDHFQYARYGIPVVFFSTGSHRDYHMVTDEAQYIDYEKLAAVSRLVYDIAVTLANRDHRVEVDRSIPDPWAMCRQ